MMVTCVLSINNLPAYPQEAAERRPCVLLFFFSSRRRHTRFDCDWSSDVCSSDLAQVNPTSPVPQRESIQELLNRLTPQQKQQFDNAGKSYKENQFVEAFAIYKRLLTELSGDAILSKFASEAGLNSGDQSFALTILKPLAQADPDDWQAAAPLTRACAESGDMSCRDSGMVHMLDLHRRGITPPNMQQYVVERVKTGENILLIRMSLEPWGRYKVYALGQLFNSEGKMLFRVTLESNDTDQPLFAKEQIGRASCRERV